MDFSKDPVLDVPITSDPRIGLLGVAKTRPDNDGEVRDAAHTGIGAEDGIELVLEGVVPAAAAARPLQDYAHVGVRRRDVAHLPDGVLAGLDASMRRGGYGNLPQ
eukprot:gene2274-biopygen11018